MYKRYCDRCDKEIPDYKNYVEIRLRETFSSEEFEEDVLHLCHDCHTKIKLFMANRDQNVVPSYKSVIRDPIDNSL